MIFLPFVSEISCVISETLFQASLPSLFVICLPLYVLRMRREGRGVGVGGLFLSLSSSRETIISTIIINNQKMRLEL